MLKSSFTVEYGVNCEQLRVRETADGAREHIDSTLSVHFAWYEDMSENQARIMRSNSCS